ncbi:hypothetical protein [Rhizobium sp. G21]|uniref:hypothetical protein n=1 Tax=Rhizobium sp. G21 TaxID=2758439 RepID=UPI0016038913|nr:hypothetical protein [Rhizobium sp. G21]MBB1247665.1 hypothetical protein [Rhizobium sp. G21]
MTIHKFTMFSLDKRAGIVIRAVWSALFMGGLAQALSLLFASQTLMATRQRPFHADLWEGRRRPPDGDPDASGAMAENFRPY